MVLAMFPGQGSQHPEMSKNLLEQSALVRTIFEQAEDTTKMSLKKICSEADSYDKLQLTTYQQPAILTHSYAIWSLFKEESEVNPSFYAGHSLGEYTALVAAEKISFEKALSLVCFRAKAMQEAVPKGVGGMLAARTKDYDTLNKICVQIRSDRDEVLEIVNFNSAEQYILSGHMTAIDEAAQLLRENKIRSIKLDVSAPFHSSLMKPAREAMTPKILDTPFTQNDNCVVANVTGTPAQPYEPELLIKQIDNPVLWSKTINSVVAEGVKRFIEFGPQKVLASLAKRSIPKGSEVLDTSDPFKTLQSFA